MNTIKNISIYSGYPASTVSQNIMHSYVVCECWNSIKLIMLRISTTVQTSVQIL